MTKAKLVVVALSWLALTICAGTVTLAGPVTYTLPSETATLKQATDPGYEKAQNTCSVCHSVDHITSQPRGKGKDFWTAEVKKMIAAYGAPVEAADQPAIVDYLSKSY